MVEATSRIFGFAHKPTLFRRSILNISNQLKQLDEIVRTVFIPATSVKKFRMSKQIPTEKQFSKDVQP